MDIRALTQLEASSLLWLHYAAAARRACPQTRGDSSVAVRPPNRSRIKSRWQSLRRLLGKAPAAGSVAAGQVIHDYFRHQAHSQGYTLSHSQQRVIDCMARQACILLDATPKLLPGLYLHGAVGRGKSWLLDGFFRAIPLAEKQRLHVHEFFVQLHQGMFEHRERADALAITLDALLSDCRVLCFCLLYTSDAADE